MAWRLFSLLTPGFAQAAAPLDEAAEARAVMVVEQLAARGITDAAVLDALRTVPRHRFLPPELWAYAHLDQPVPVGRGQTISQPYIVAFMSEVLQVRPGMKVLEVGTGTGYQAAVLAELGADVVSIEIIPELSQAAAGHLRVTGYADRVRLVVGDGYQGVPDAAPFDRIIVTAAPDHVPPALVDQLAPGGRMVIPVGEEYGEQELRIITRDRAGRVHTEALLPVRFVPMTGKARGDP